MKVRITEYLEIDLSREMWCCQRCSGDLVPATENYKRGCRVKMRDTREVYRPLVETGAYTFAPDPDYCRLLEFYCPHCAAQVENEYLPPGHPITHDIQVDLTQLKEKYGLK